MDKFAIMPEQERRDILQEAAGRRDLAEIVIEKDFWVCWTLKRLFSNPALHPHLTFKGGTSLSKAYGLIERFSEDIDLTINRKALHLSSAEDPMEKGITGKELKRRTDALKQKAQNFVEQAVLPTLEADIKAILGDTKEWSIVLDSEDSDRQTLLFYYPKIFSYTKIDPTKGGPLRLGRLWWFPGQPVPKYIKPHIKLEFGARGEIEPSEIRTITSYAAETFPMLFESPSWQVATLGAERTFWEKATILHALYHGSKLRDRMSRHYYDTYMLAEKGIADKAIKTPALLEHVVRNKSLLFKDTKASYETAKLGSLRLTPNTELLPILKQDYGKMAEMFMGKYPDFDTVMAGLDKLEKRINHVSIQG